MFLRNDIWLCIRGALGGDVLARLFCQEWSGADFIWLVELAELVIGIFARCASRYRRLCTTIGRRRLWGRMSS